MNGTMSQITVYRFGQFGQIERIEGELVTLDGLAARAGLHPTLIERFVEYGLIEPVERAGAHMLFDVEHLLASLLEQERGLAVSILNKAEINVDALKQRVEQELQRLPKVSGPAGAPDQIYVTGRLNRLLTQAEDEAKKLKDDYVSVEHLLLAMTDDMGPTGRIFHEFGVTREGLMRALQEVRGSQRVTSQNPEATYEALERYGRDLTRLAEQGKLDPVIGRDEEIRRTIQVLSR